MAYEYLIFDGNSLTYESVGGNFAALPDLRALLYFDKRSHRGLVPYDATV
jgi:hypothetical protein